MLRALAVLRGVVLVNTLVLAWLHRDTFVRPGLTVVCLAVITVWTGVAVWAYDDPARRRAPLLVTDLGLTLAAVLLSPATKGDQLDSTLPGFWVMGAVLAWAIVGGWRLGLVASLIISVADLAVRPSITQTNYGNVFLLMLGGPIVGFCAQLLQDMARQRDRAERVAAAAAERVRLARVVHDGVLQVLSLVQRRGTELGGEAAELGRLAGEQEVALRALVQTTEASYRPEADGDRDLGAMLTALQGRASPRVQVAVPGTPVPLPAPVAEEVVAVVRACLHNVSDHVGSDARAWLLLEDLGDAVRLSVRDEGPGIPAGRLDQARGDGRLGVAESIRGRVVGVGGTATLTTAPGQGTEWEFTIPRGTA